MVVRIAAQIAALLALTVVKLQGLSVWICEYGRGARRRQIAEILLDLACLGRRQPDNRIAIVITLRTVATRRIVTLSLAWSLLFVSRA
jgi:hypothetical protein